MTNKYDVKNFADIIDKFSVEEEIKLIQENVHYAMEVGRLPLKQTIFDPVIKMEEKENSCYEFVEYVPKKYNIHELPEKDDNHLINQPPLRLQDYEIKEELINYIIDKAFTPQYLSNEHVSVMIELFKENQHRETFIGLLEKDYEHLNLSFKRPEEIAQKQLAVNLPQYVFRNIAGLFHVFLDQLAEDEKVPKTTMRDQLMKIMLFANLMINENHQDRHSILQQLSPSKIWQKVEIL